ncbi:MAG: alpha-L-glutamate ligase [Candidatus Altiarchaeales archaeon WOR_SM1_79]|nr:MAG: alpha-L-glutamate ligase [Candidatus Altiarchaeales archaeon WOR_SM1_79]
MEGWVLYKHSEDEIKQGAYEINRFIESARKRDINLKVVKPEQVDLIVTRDDRKSILIDGKATPLPDFVLPRRGASTTYFALAVIRHLERLGVHVINSSQSIDTVKDKLFTQQILAQSGLPVPKTMLAKYPINIDLIEKQFGFPVIVKTISGSQGRGVFLCETKSSFEDLMLLINATRANVNLIIQEFIKTSKGRDLRVFVIGGRIVACMERKAMYGGFKANYSRGGEVRKYETNQEIEWLSTESARILGLDIAGIDLLFDGEHYKICEANSAPGFKGVESCCEISIPDEIYNFVKIRLGLFS